MRQLITFIFLTIISISAYSQSNYQDVVYLKDGSIYRGIILEQIPNKTIKLEIIGKNLIVFKMEDIEKMTREPISAETATIQPVSEKETNSVKTEDGKLKRYRGQIELGYDIGVGNYGVDRIRLNIINGYRVYPFLSVGFGTGLRYFHGSGDLYVPAFLDLRVNILDTKISPYVAIGTGYSMRVTDGFAAGFMFNPTIGAQFKTSPKLAMNFGFGYDLLRLNTSILGALSFNLGLSF
jgi:V8-like Glu-specific endopeptidase